jgi:hypothetical protein
VPRPRILAITTDAGFYSSVLGAICDLGWSADWATTISRGLEICAKDPVHIVIYDRHLPRTDWRGAFDLLAAHAARARILPATPSIDQDLWQMVLRRRGYDVLVRSAGSEQLRRETRFASLSIQESGDRGGNTSSV